MNKLSIDRMLEIEEMVNNNTIIFPLKDNEWFYYERAYKIPFNEIYNFIIEYQKYILPIEYIIYSNKLFEKYNCSEKELYQRIEDVNTIIKYKEFLNKNLLKEQKKMIKRMNNY